MKERVVAKNIELEPEIKLYVKEKLKSLEKYFPDISSDEIIAEIDLGRPSKHHRKGDVFRCEINLTISGNLLRAEERGNTLIEVIDRASGEIDRQARKTKEKQKTKFLRGARKLARKIKFFDFKK